MFSDEITTSDAFLDMPQESQLLYFHLGMSADDDGFIGSPKMIMRHIGASDDTYKLLLAKKFILQFERGICVVKHWRINNQIRKDRYTETKYREEKMTLYIKENGAYTTDPQKGLPVPSGHFAPTEIRELPSGNHLATNGQPSIGKVSKDKDSKDTGGGKKTSKKKKEKVYSAELPDWLDRPTWELWVGHRKDIRKPLTDKAIDLQIKTLEEYKSIHKEIILKSIENGWTGLFPDSIRNKSAYPSKGSVPANVLKDSHTQELIDNAKAKKIKLT